MDFLKIIEEGLLASEAKKALQEIEHITRNISPNDKRYIKAVQEAIILLSDKYNKTSLVYAGNMIQNKYGKNLGNISYLIKNPIRENNNPYLTPFQKYQKNHPNQNGHQHSMRRTTGNDTERQTKEMVPNVRKNLRSPYKNDAVNKSQSQSKILTPIEIQQISNDYNIDFDDRRIKTIKGKTNMILTPLNNGGWKLEHR